MIIPRVRLLYFSCLFLVIIVVSTMPALAANNAIRMVRLSLAQGDVQIDRNAGDGWEQAIVNMPVVGGARIYAAENSKAELEFEDGSSVRLIGPAQVTMTELSSAPNGNPVNFVQVDSGMVYVNARLQHNDDFRIATSNGETFAITQPSHLRFKVDQQIASLSVIDGEAALQNGDTGSTVHAGETYNSVLGQPESATRQETVPAEPEDTWDQQRDTYNDQYASAGAQDSGSEDPNAYGVADLGYYGNYANVPGYGVCWRPAGFDADWDPFGYGAWSYYPGWGWTFISGYRWGWAPFYYGNWFYARGSGWWWRPGPWHSPHHPGGGGWHPQPRFAGHPDNGWSAPRPPTQFRRGTVAVAGSHLPVGPIGATHAPGAVYGGLSASRGISGHGFVGGTGGLSAGSAERVGSGSRVVAGHVSSSSGVSIVGRPGSYSLSGSTSGRNGYEVHRPSMGYVSRGGPEFSGPRGSDHTGVYGGGGTTRALPGPSSTVHVSPPPAAVAPPPSSVGGISSAPHSGPVSTGAAGGFHGGGVSSSGGFSGGGGGFHGGGGHR